METKTYRFENIEDVNICREYFEDDVISWDKVRRLVTVRDCSDCINYELEQDRIHGWEE